MEATTDEIALSPAERKALKARAHHLKPVLIVGDAGLSATVLAEGERALAAHGLIKVRVLGDDRARRDVLMRELCAALGCAPVQSIGKLLVVYRPRLDEHAPAAVPGSRRRRGPHQPKKAAGARTQAGAGTNASGTRAPAKTAANKLAKKAAKKAAKKSARKSPPTRGSTPMATTTKKSLSDKTAGKRTDLHAADKPPARKRAPTKATQGPPHLQGKSGPRTSGRRDRAKGG